MFAIAARYDQAEAPPLDPGNLWEAGLDYMVQAREVLSALLFVHFSFLGNMFTIAKTGFTIIAEEQRAKPYCF
jgi:hypothetical protein